jgi:hypothetical protein
LLGKSRSISLKIDMTEDQPHPLSRMATIKRPSFWIFFGTCVVLYVYNKSATYNAGDIMKYSRYGNYVCLATFTGLFFTLTAGMIKKPQVNRFFMIFCYVFEIVSVGWLGALIVIR